MTAFDPPIRALAFDVFGTIVDWRGGVARELAAVATAKGIALDADAFADAWRDGYQPAMQRVRVGDLPWMRIDALHRLILDTLLPRFGLDGLNEVERDHLNRAWHRLDPWPDAREGLALLKRRFTITPLSNGNFSLLTNMAKRAALPWDCVISAELFRHYKPDHETYLGTADLLGIGPAELMLVACHPSDLRAAKAAGLRTGYVARPLENGPAGPIAACDPAEFDIVAADFVDLDRAFAQQVDCGKHRRAFAAGSLHSQAGRQAVADRSTATHVGETDRSTRAARASRDRTPRCEASDRYPSRAALHAADQETSWTEYVVPSSRASRPRPRSRSSAAPPGRPSR